VISSAVCIAKRGYYLRHRKKKKTVLLIALWGAIIYKSRVGKSTEGTQDRKTLRNTNGCLILQLTL